MDIACIKYVDSDGDVVSFPVWDLPMPSRRTRVEFGHPIPDEGCSDARQAAVTCFWVPREPDQGVSQADLNSLARSVLEHLEIQGVFTLHPLLENGNPEWDGLCLFPAPVLVESPMSALDAQAIELHEIYESYLRASFTPDQAIYLVGRIVASDSA